MSIMDLGIVDNFVQSIELRLKHILCGYLNTEMVYRDYADVHRYVLKDDDEPDEEEGKDEDEEDNIIPFQCGYAKGLIVTISLESVKHSLEVSIQSHKWADSIKAKLDPKGDFESFKCDFQKCSINIRSTSLICRHIAGNVSSTQIRTTYWPVERYIDLEPDNNKFLNDCEPIAQMTNRETIDTNHRLIFIGKDLNYTLAQTYAHKYLKNKGYKSTVL